MIDLLAELARLKLKGAPRSSDLPGIGASWGEALIGYTSDEIRTAAFAHVRVSRFFPVISEICDQLSTAGICRRTAARDLRPSGGSSYAASPAPSDEVAGLNAVLAEYRGYTDRIVSTRGSGAAPDPVPSGAEIYAALLASDRVLPSLPYWRLVLSASGTRTHKSALAISVPLRNQADLLSAEILSAIASTYGCQTVIYSE